MDAFHSLWTKPFMVRRSRSDYEAEDFEIMTTILSALKWREKNGSVSLVTDSIGFNYIKALGLDRLYDGGISTALDNIPDFINPDIYWAGGKLYALREQSAPVVMMDTDFIVWEKLLFDNIPAPAAVIHREDMYPDIYPDPSEFILDDGYSLDPELDRDTLPANTAFLYIKDPDFLRYYTDTAIEFMEHTKRADNFLTYMVFAEQRLISMCARKQGFEITALSDLGELFAHGEGCFTHTWGFKEQMRQNQKARALFLEKCRARILADFPEYEDIIPPF